MKPDPNIAFILAFFLPGVDRMYIGRPGLGVLKLITVYTAPIWGALTFFTGTLVASLEGLTGGEARGVVFVAVLVGITGVIWWFADLFLIRDAACAMRLNPYCIDPDTIDLDDEDELAVESI